MTDTSELFPAFDGLSDETLTRIEEAFPTLEALADADVASVGEIDGIDAATARRLVHGAAAAIGNPIDVEAFRHRDTRANIPSEEHALLVDTSGDGTADTLLYPRDPDLDPQLVWKGKDQLDAGPLRTPIVPIYIQERIVPQAIVENLRDTEINPSDEPELTLFDDFDGIDDPIEKLDYYRFDANWSNRMILGDALVAMTSLAEKENLKGQVQTVYIDPPYGVKFNSNWQVSTRDRSVADGRDLTPQPEQIRAFRDTWKHGIHSYLCYLRDRLQAAHLLLNETGSVFVQISDDNLHVVRSLLDEVFGPDNYVSTIVFTKTSSATSGGLATVNDYLVWYARDRDRMKYRQLYRWKSLGGDGTTAYTRALATDGTSRTLTPEEKAGITPVRAGERVYRLDNLTSQRPPGSFPVEFEGQTFVPGRGYWKTNVEGMERLQLAGRVALTGATLKYVRFLEDFGVYPLTNVWTDTLTAGFASDKVYVVQTNPSVIERCLLMTSDPGDLVLDPTCGSGTTALVAEKWGRRWITMDTSRVALALARRRIMAARFPYYLLADSPEGAAAERAESGRQQPEPEGGWHGDLRRGFVYKRALHIMLSTISRCEEIVPGMSQEAIDAAIRRAADYEMLYDQPREDSDTVRVAGPFTVETLSPHRTVAIDEIGGTSASFAELVIDNLDRAGVQNGYRDERLELGWIEPHAGTWVHALGGFVDSDGNDQTVAISIGPEQGTVGREHVAEAVKEATREVRADLLLICGFAFDAGAGEQASTETDAEHTFTVDGQRTVGRVRVLNVRISSELMMGEELKNTGAGNLFTVFGEPDIDVMPLGDGTIEVTLRGLDIYDPNTGTIRSSDPKDIACWFIDTDYDGDAFYVRHAYFTGADDPYKSLRTALRSEISDEAWDRLYRVTSMPFPPPPGGRIAVKAINHYGDEALKVFQV